MVVINYEITNNLISVAGLIIYLIGLKKETGEMLNTGVLTKTTDELARWHLAPGTNGTRTP
jgi:hypothetical protein